LARTWTVCSLVQKHLKAAEQPQQTQQPPPQPQLAWQQQPPEAWNGQSMPIGQPVMPVVNFNRQLGVEEGAIAEIRALFGAMDADGDSLISLDEFVRGVAALPGLPPQFDPSAAFRLLVRFPIFWLLFVGWFCDRLATDLGLF